MLSDRSVLRILALIDRWADYADQYCYIYSLWIETLKKISPYANNEDVDDCSFPDRFDRHSWSIGPASDLLFWSRASLSWANDWLRDACHTCSTRHSANPAKVTLPTCFHVRLERIRYHWGKVWRRAWDWQCAEREPVVHTLERTRNAHRQDEACQPTMSIRYYSDSDTSSPCPEQCVVSDACWSRSSNLLAQSKVSRY